MRLIQRIDMLHYILLVSLAANIVGIVCFANASHHLKSLVNERELQVQTLPPAKDDCSGSMIIPSNFSGPTYTTPRVSILNATLSAGPPYHRCYLLGITKDVWYRYKPLKTNFYSFNTSFGDAQVGIFADTSDFMTADCEIAFEQNCLLARPSFDVELTANITYFILVQPALTNVSGPLQLILHRRRPPSNNLCSNATIINPTVETLLTIDDNAFAFHEETEFYPEHIGCQTIDDPTFWYKFQNPLSTPLSVDVTVNTGVRYTQKNIAIIAGANCSALQCIGGVFNYHDHAATLDFVAEPRTWYYILLQVTSIGPFNVTIKGRTQFLSVIDSGTNKAIQLLKDNISYLHMKSSSLNLNIQARFTTSPELIKSVRVTFDNPKRNVCERKAPYSVFGDRNGAYKNVTIPLGQHRVTATPYLQPNCTGTAAGTALAQNFTVTGCFTQFTIVAGRQYVFLRPFTSEDVSAIHAYNHTRLPVMLTLKCKVSLYTQYRCGGFPLQSTRTDLRNATNGKLIHTSNSLYLFENGHLPVGDYTLQAFADNVSHPAINFTVVRTTGIC